MPGVTISAGYGAGGSIVAPAVAEQLGVVLLDRAISSAVAAQLEVTTEEAATGAAKRSGFDRFVSLLSPLSGGVLGAGTDAAPPEALPIPTDADAFREYTERILREALPAGAVILGRAGAAALRNEPGVLRVRLFGPPEACIAQGMRIERVEERIARTHLEQIDRARRHYVQRLYRVDIDDPTLFHLQIDSTVIPLDACAALIVSAYHARAPE
jgi:cytidylate kinase